MDPFGSVGDVKHCQDAGASLKDEHLTSFFVFGAFASNCFFPAPKLKHQIFLTKQDPYKFLRDPQHLRNLRIVAAILWRQHPT